MKFAPAGEDAVESHLTLSAPYHGWKGIAHGGIVAMLLDEAMAYAAATRRLMGMTAEMKMRFRHPVPLGVPLAVRGRIVWQRRNVLGLEATVSDGGGGLLASATGSFVSAGELAPGERLQGLEA